MWCNAWHVRRHTCPVHICVCLCVCVYECVCVSVCVCMHRLVPHIIGDFSSYSTYIECSCSPVWGINLITKLHLQFRVHACACSIFLDQWGKLILLTLNQWPLTIYVHTAKHVHILIHVHVQCMQEFQREKGVGHRVICEASFELF